MKRILAILSLAVAGCGGGPPPASFESVHDVKETMRLVLDPAADIIWDSAGEIITADGVEDLAPTTERGGCGWPTPPRSLPNPATS